MNMPDTLDCLHSILKIPGLCVILLDFRGKILQANEAACAFFGYAAHELVGSAIAEHTFPSEDQIDAGTAFSDGSGYHAGMSCSKRFIGKDGGTLWGRISVSRVNEAEGAASHNLLVIQDVTDSRNLEDRLARERGFLQSVVDSLLDPVKVVGLDRQVLAMNRAAREMLPCHVRHQKGVYCDRLSQQFQLPCLAGSGSCNLEKIRVTGEPIRTLYRHQSDADEELVFEITAAPLVDEGGGMIGIVEISRNITERLAAEAKIEENEKRLEFITHYDLLTGLPNQNLLLDRLKHALARAQRFSEKFAVILIDLNRFRQVNDSLGYQAGDRVLAEVARRLACHVRKSDTLARLRGDEFVIVLEKFDNANRVVEMARRLLVDVAREVSIENVPVSVTANIGISLFPEDATQADTLLRCADAALQGAREEGRNTYRFYTTGMTRQSRQRLELESQLRTALQDGQLMLHYQPQFEIATGACVGTEALMRWQHPQRGMVSPGEFIPLAEDNGFIEPMGLWSLRTACLLNRSLQSKGLAPRPVAVNISARQLYRSDFPETVGCILHETGLDPAYLELEITESMLMKDLDVAISTMQKLNDLGVSIAMDDFGTGYSSLSNLHQLPIKKLKIDRSFIRDMVEDDNARAIARSIIALANSLGLRVIAEGVETHRQLSLLREMGCSEVQGFLLSRPLPAPALEDFLNVSGQTS